MIAKRLSEIQIECLCQQVRQVILFGLASHDQGNDRSSANDEDLADEVVVGLKERLSEYSWLEIN